MQNYYPVPFVIEKTGRGERQYDIYSRLLEDRIIFLGTQVTDDVANAVMAQLLFLDKSGRNQDIKIYICLLYTSPSPRDQRGSRMPSSA